MKRKQHSKAFQPWKKLQSNHNKHQSKYEGDLFPSSYLCFVLIVLKLGDQLSTLKEEKDRVLSLQEKSAQDLQKSFEESEKKWQEKV